MNRSNKKKLILAAAALTMTAGASYIILEPTVTHAAFSFSMEPVQQTLTGANGAGIRKIWTDVLATINYLIIGVLIFVGFAQILRLNINTYGIKKVLPSLIFAIIAANFSFIFVRVLVDFVNVLESFFINGPSDAANIKGAFNAMNNEWTPISDMGGFIPAIFRIIFLLIATVGIFILAFLFIVRNWVIYFLVVLSPLAFMATVLPQTKSAFSQWWSNFTKWLFMPLISLFWLWLGNQWIASALISSGGAIMSFAFALICLYLAITTPMKVGGAAMNWWAGAGKKVWGATGGNVVKGARDRVSAWGSEQWAKQGASGNSLNPIRAIIQAGKRNQEYIEHHKAKTKNYDESATAAVRTNNDKIRRMINERRSYGGALEQAEAEIKLAYQQTGKGEDWMRGREMWKAKMKGLEEESKREDAHALRNLKVPGYSQNAKDIEKQDEMRRLSQQAFLAQRETGTFEQDMAEVDKWMAVDFAEKTGQFGNDADAQRISDLYFAAMTRNKELDESVSKSESERVNGILRDQVKIHNLAQTVEEEKKNTLAVQRLDEDLRNLGNQLIEAQRTGQDTSRISDSISKKTTERADRAAKAADLTRKSNEAKAKAWQMASDPNKRYLQGMVTQDENGETTIDGFAGLVSGDEERKKRLGSLMQKRASKLLSADIAGDVSKYMEEKTPDEIRQEFAEGAGSDFSQEDVVNFFSGNRQNIEPKHAQEIEARLQVVQKWARQRNDPYATPSKGILAEFIGDEDSVGAAQMVNKRLLETAAQTKKGRERILERMIMPNIDQATAQAMITQINSELDNAGNDIDALEAVISNRLSQVNELVRRGETRVIKKQLSANMQTRQSNVDNITLSAINDQTNMGARKSATSYLSSPDIQSQLESALITANQATLRDVIQHIQTNGLDGVKEAFGSLTKVFKGLPDDMKDAVKDSMTTGMNKHIRNLTGVLAAQVTQSHNIRLSKEDMTKMAQMLREGKSLGDIDVAIRESLEKQNQKVSGRLFSQSQQPAQSAGQQTAAPQQQAVPTTSKSSGNGAAQAAQAARAESTAAKEDEDVPTTQPPSQ